MIIFLIVSLALAIAFAILAFKAYLNIKEDYHLLEEADNIVRNYAEELEGKVNEYKKRLNALYGTQCCGIIKEEENVGCDDQSDSGDN